VLTFFRYRLHLILCSLIALWSWPRYLGVRIDGVDFVVVPLVVFAVYQWNRLTDWREDAINCPADLQSALRHRRLIIGGCIAAIAAVVAAAVSAGSPSSNLVLAIVCALGFLYSTTLVRGRPTLRLKSVFLVKNVASAAGWSLLTVIYPFLHGVQSVDRRMWLAFAAMFTGVFSSEVIWDVRDVQGDRAGGVGSLPARCGSAAARLAVDLVNAVFSAVVIGGVVLHAWSASWLFTLTNSLICVAAAQQLERVSQRLGPHVLVLVQSILLLGLGFLRA
jgi:4-hydroxybenzoate polyprenyltransferase